MHNYLLFNVGRNKTLLIMHKPENMNDFEILYCNTINLEL
jgi:hypothetical protein